MVHTAVALMVSTCDECGKRGYATKRAAKLAGRAVDRRCRPYRCGRYWHFGHLPTVVIRGEYDRRRVFEMRGRGE